MDRRMNLNLKHLEAFAAVARKCSFTKAARELSLSQPALTVQIRQLEQRLAVRLLDRNSRSVRLTAAGEELAPVVERLLAEMGAIVQSAGQLAAQTRGQVRVAALPSIASTVLPRMIAGFRRAYPGARVHVRDVMARQVAALVENDEADVGLGIQDEAWSRLAFQPLFRDRMCLVLGAGSPLLSKRRLGLSDLKGHALILTERGSSVRLLVDKALAAAGVDVKPAFEVSLMSTAAGLVRAGLGAAILPSASFEMGELAGLRIRRLDDVRLEREIGVLTQPGRLLTPAAAGFVECVQQSPAVVALRRVGPVRDR